MNAHFKEGLRHGVPIALGYFSVAIGFGIMAVNAGLSIAEAVGISVSNLTSAGQVAGVGIIAAGGTIFEMILTQFVINLRYSLMGISLSQKLDERFNTPHRMIAAFGITDEIFAVCAAYPGKLTPEYMYGVTIIATIGWGGGTFVGAAMGALLPPLLSDALGIMLYGMFLAVFIPAARGDRGTLVVVIAAAGLSILFYYVFTAVSSGFAIILCSVAAAAVGALLFPVKEEEEDAA